MQLESLLQFALLTSTLEVVWSYKMKNTKGMLMDFDYLVSQLYLQHCTFVEIGEGVCSLFVELPMDISYQHKRSLKKQLYFGNCLCSELREWQLCSHQLSQQRPDDCVFEEGVACPASSARVHRRLCDVTGMSQWNPQCNCSVTLGDMSQESLCGFRTCYVSPLPSAICSPRSVCGTAHCNTSLHGVLYSVRCDRKCKEHQPFCERTGPATSVKRVVESQWGAWRPVTNGDKSSLQQYFTECLDPQGNPAFDCLGPGLLCCTREEGDCICEVKQQDGRLMAFRYAITLSRPYDRGQRIVKVRSAGNQGQLNVWNRFLDIAREDGSDSLFARSKPKVHHATVNEKSHSAQDTFTEENRAKLKTIAGNIISKTTTEITTTSDKKQEDPVTFRNESKISNDSQEVKVSKNILKVVSNSSLKGLSQNVPAKEVNGDNDAEQPIALHPISIKTSKSSEEENEKDLNLQNLHATHIHNVRHYEKNNKYRDRSKLNKKQESSITDRDEDRLKNVEDKKTLGNNAAVNPQILHTSTKMSEITSSTTQTVNIVYPTSRPSVQYTEITSTKRLNLGGVYVDSSKKTAQGIDISTESVKVLNNKPHNNSESINNGESHTVENSSDISPKAADMPFSLNNQSNDALNGIIKNNISEDSSNNRVLDHQNSSNSDYDSYDDEEELLHDVSTQCVNLFNNTLYNMSDYDNDDGNQKQQVCSNITDSPKAGEIPCNNKSDIYINGILNYNLSDGSNYNVSQVLHENSNKSNDPKAADTKNVSNHSQVDILKTDKSLVTSLSVTNLTYSKPMTTTEHSINNRTTQITVFNDSISRTPPDEWDLKLRNVSTYSTKVNSNVLPIDENKYEGRNLLRLTTQKTKLNNHNGPFQRLKDLDPILEKQLHSKDVDSNAYDEPEPVLKDFDKENVNLSDETDNILVDSYRNVKDDKESGFNKDKSGKKSDKSISQNFMSSHNKLKSKILSDV